MTNFADVQMLRDFAAYAASKPEGATYNYVDPSNCAVAQFLRDCRGVAEPSVGPEDWCDHAGDAPRVNYPLPWAVNEAAARGDETWAAAHERAVRHLWAADAALCREFRDWCRTRPPLREYGYAASKACASAQYLKSLGFNPSVGSDNWFDLGDYRTGYTLPPVLDEAVRKHDRNFGSLGIRLDIAASYCDLQAVVA